MRRTLFRQLSRIAGLFIFALFASGCFQAVGAALLATSVPGSDTLPTIDPLTIDATNTAIAAQQTQAADQAAFDATNVSLTQTALAPTATVGDAFGETATPDLPTLPPFDAPTNTPQEVAQLPTSTATEVVIIQAATWTPQPTQTPYPTQTPLPTYTPFPTFTPFPTLIAELPTQPPLVIGFPTPTLFIPTLDPALVPGSIAAATQPGVTAVAQVDPAQQTQEALYLQATAIIATVTAQAGLNLTATSVALGTPMVAVPGATDVFAPIGATAPPGSIVITTTPQGTWGAAGSGASGPIDANGIYTVQSGDTLYSIGRRFNTTANAIAAANGITNPTLIVPGQQLRIPGAYVTSTPLPVVPPAGITLAPGATLDPNATVIIITATPSGGAGSGQTYVVQEGDTLFSIAMRFRVTVTALAQYNGISNINLIYMGQTLRIP